MERKKLPQPKKNLDPRPTRPPVVVVLGHIDHGKTTLLDFIRKTQIAAKEAGGITQSIGAYVWKAGIPDDSGTRIGRPSNQATASSGVPPQAVATQQPSYRITQPPSRRITFIDTPGHEAFSKMRERGAAVADVAVLVVAADDGVKPQTVEAIAHAKAAGIPLVVAINKVDLASPQDLTKVKGQLAKEEVITEDQGGKVPAVAVSAKTGQGIPELLEMISLVADLLELKSEPEAPLSAIVIESLLSTKQGPLATLVLKKGMLRVGDQIFAGEVSGKVKALVADTGQRVPAAGPGMPVQVLGFSAVPAVGALVTGELGDLVAGKEVQVSEKPSTPANQPPKASLATGGLPSNQPEGLNVILRADTQGTLEAVVGALGKLKSEGKGINLLLKSVGPIGDSDVRLAATARGVILGFNVPVSSSTQKLADDLQVGVRSFKIIYELLEAAEKLLAGAQALAEEEKVPEAEVLAIFALLSGDVVAGVRVLHGKIKYRDRIKVLRGEEIVHQGKVRGLRIGTENVSEIKGAQEAGVLVKPNFEFQKGDRIVLSS